MTHDSSSILKSALLTLLLSFGFQTLFAAGEGRIAVVADGNYRDTDDVCGTPVSMAILHSLGLADKLVHYSHSCDITPAGKDAGQGQEAEREKMMAISCEGTADRWGAFPNVTKYYNCKREYDAAVGDLKKAINASTHANLLYIIEAGEPDVIYDAMVAANQAKRGFVRIITHHPHNDRGDKYDLTDIEAIAGINSKMVIRIPDQNAGLKNDLSDWHWARDHEDYRITWLWDRGEVAEDRSWGYKGIRGSFDCSDAGMIWFWATGEDDCSKADLQSAFTTYVDNNSAHAWIEAEKAEISKGKIKKSFEVSGQRYVAGSSGFNLAWNFSATAADHDIFFFVSSPKGTQTMGVFVNGTKVGTVSANNSWTKQAVSAKLTAGNNVIELRDSEGSKKLNVDMLLLTTKSRDLSQD